PKKKLFWKRVRALLSWATLVLLVGYSYEHYGDVQTKTVQVPVARLPECMDGLRVAVAADLHAGTLADRGDIEELVERLNALGPDVVVVVGDVSDGEPGGEAGEILAPLADVEAPEGKFFVTGNHEDFYADAEEWEVYMEGLGYTVLANGLAEITRGGDAACRLQVAGVRDGNGGGGGGGADLDGALAGLDPGAGGSALLLAHQPRVFAAARERGRGVGLQISGHTHGG
ncbi:unnamed protein product, partial [Heterosigma akashiwo]